MQFSKDSVFKYVSAVNNFSNSLVGKRFDILGEMRRC